MRIARPPDGFRILERATVKALMEHEATRWPRLPQYWLDIKERLRFVAHREGIEDRRLGPGHRLFVAKGFPQYALPTIRLVYHLLGDTVTIEVVAVLGDPP